MDPDVGYFGISQLVRAAESGRLLPRVDLAGLEPQSVLKEVCDDMDRQVVRHPVGVAKKFAEVLFVVRDQRARTGRCVEQIEAPS